MTESRYTPELADLILDRVSSGEPLRQVCREDGMPAESSVRQWVRDDRDGLAAKDHQARASQIDCWADEILTISYRDDIDPADKRVITENLRWLLSKLAPQRYGDRLLVAGDQANPIQHLHQQVSLNELTDEQLDALEAFAKSMLVEQRSADEPHERRRSVYQPTRQRSSDEVA